MIHFGEQSALQYVKEFVMLSNECQESIRNAFQILMKRVVDSEKKKFSFIYFECYYVHYNCL